MEKISLTIIFLVLLSFGSQAQDTGTVVRRLAAGNGPQGASVMVTEQGDAAQVVRLLDNPRPQQIIRGYRINIFFDNQQNSRELASGTYAKFKELFPDIPAYMTYQNPDFKVSVGNFITMEEAIILWGRISGVFDKAVVAREDIPLSAFAEAQQVQ